MVSATVWSLLLLAGFASCSPSKRPDWIPDRPDWLPNRPDWLPDRPDWLPDRPDWWPENWERPEWWPIGPDGEFVRPEWWPEDWQRPEWWPIGPDGEFIRPEWWPEEWERPEWWPIGPDGEWVKPEWWPEEWERPEWWPENWERPDWWPIGPDGEWERPDWWPIGPDGEWIKPEWWPEDWEKPDWWPINPDGEWEKPEWWPDLENPSYVAREDGTIAEISEFPGIVQVEVGNGPLWVQGCAGSILTSLHVLSAARCFSGPMYQPRFRRIRAGSSTRNSGGVIAEVQRATNHPSFGENNFDGDITVVRLAGALVLGPTIQQTPIISQGTSLAAGLTITHAGWGITSEGSILGSDDLYQINLVITDREACAERYLNTPVPIVVSENSICVAQTGSAGRDHDVRDSGAPVYYDNILVGIVSSGFFFGNGSFPVVNTAVSPYTEWIVATAA